MVAGISLIIMSSSRRRRIYELGEKSGSADISNMEVSVTTDIVCIYVCYGGGMEIRSRCLFFPGFYHAFWTLACTTRTGFGRVSSVANPKMGQIWCSSRRRTAL